MYNISKKHLIRKIILNIIRTSNLVSRTGIKNTVDLRMATVIEIVRELIDEGLVLESGSMDTADIKKKKLLCLNNGLYYAVGVDIQGEKAAAVMTDLKGEALKKSEKGIKPDMDREKILEAVFHAMDQLLEGVEKSRILGIGISNPGILSKGKDRIIFSSQLKNWRDVPIKALVEERYRLPVHVDDSALLNLMAEKWFGKAFACENVIYVQMGASFGLSVISGGNFVRGASGMAGEIGHTMVEPKGELCICGNYGCLQTAASSGVIVRKVRDLLKKGAYSLVSDIVRGDPDRIDIQTVIDAAEKNDKISLGVLEEAARYIGIALSNTINLLNPDMIIFGGQMVKGNSFITEPVKRVISTNALQLASRDIVYEIASFNGDGGALGAAAMVLDEFFEYTKLKNLDLLIS